MQAEGLAFDWSMDNLSTIVGEDLDTGGLTRHRPVEALFGLLLFFSAKGKARRSQESDLLAECRKRYILRPQMCC